jgi:hypothetical protein
MRPEPDPALETIASAGKAALAVLITAGGASLAIVIGVGRRERFSSPTTVPPVAAISLTATTAATAATAASGDDAVTEGRAKLPHIRRAAATTTAATGATILLFRKARIARSARDASVAPRPTPTTGIVAVKAIFTGKTARANVDLEVFPHRHREGGRDLASAPTVAPDASRVMDVVPEAIPSIAPECAAGPEGLDGHGPRPGGGVGVRARGAEDLHRRRWRGWRGRRRWRRWRRRQRLLHRENRARGRLPVLLVRLLLSLLFLGVKALLGVAPRLTA